MTSHRDNGNSRTVPHFIKMKEFGGLAPHTFHAFEPELVVRENFNNMSFSEKSPYSHSLHAALFCSGYGNL